MGMTYNFFNKIRLFIGRVEHCQQCNKFILNRKNNTKNRTSCKKCFTNYMRERIKQIYNGKQKIEQLKKLDKKWLRK